MVVTGETGYTRSSRSSRSRETSRGYSFQNSTVQVAEEKGTGQEDEKGICYMLNDDL
ncbi:hypothetical protein LY76DRAFT_589623 [Colletotrichum caudatum]|nr:hypothetical protein LY76DRAFT_589623 [Colletotrichum caudatum]